MSKWIVTWLTAGLLLGSPASADELSARERLASHAVYTEAALEMLIYAEMVTGHKDKALCINDSYFGSPPGVWLVVERLLDFADYASELVIAVYFNDNCADGHPLLDANTSLWPLAHTEDIKIEGTGDGTVFVDAGLRVLTRQATVEKQIVAANCINKKFLSGELLDSIASQLKSRDKWDVIKTTFHAVKAACDYPAGAVDESAFSPPFFDYSDSAARERLFAVRELKACDSYKIAKERSVCEGALYRQRYDGMIQEALAPVEKDLAAMRKAAWHLPDGRPIFEDKQHNWHLEDGTIISQELAATKLQPPQ